MANYKLSSEALKDLERIWAYTFESWSSEQADRYINQIIEEVEYLATKPERGKDFSYVRKGYLRSKVKLHFIFFKVDKKAQTIKIIRILHQSMDIENRLK